MAAPTRTPLVLAHAIAPRVPRWWARRYLEGMKAQNRKRFSKI